MDVEGQASEVVGEMTEYVGASPQSSKRTEKGRDESDPQDRWKMFVVEGEVNGKSKFFGIQ